MQKPGGLSSLYFVCLITGHLHLSYLKCQWNHHRPIILTREICPLSKVKSQMGRWVMCLSVTATYLPARSLVSILLVMSVKVWRSMKGNSYGMRSVLTTSVTAEVRLWLDIEIPWALIILRITTRWSTLKSPISSTEL